MLNIKSVIQLLRGNYQRRIYRTGSDRIKITKNWGLFKHTFLIDPTKWHPFLVKSHHVQKALGDRWAMLAAPNYKKAAERYNKASEILAEAGKTKEAVAMRVKAPEILKAEAKILEAEAGKTKEAVAMRVKAATSKTAAGMLGMPIETKNEDDYGCSMIFSNNDLVLEDADKQNTQDGTDKDDTPIPKKLFAEGVLELDYDNNQTPSLLSE